MRFEEQGLTGKVQFEITEAVRNQLLDAAAGAAPLEACGLLGGTGTRATRFYRLRNADASNEHYKMLPEEQFAAVRDMRKDGLRLVAIWHSHPETPARMSEEDLRLAFTPDVFYVIVSLAPAGKPPVRAFMVEDGKPIEADLKIVADASAAA